MSLALSVAQPTGVNASFWTLNTIHLNAVTQIATILMDGYLSADARTAGCLPITTTAISVTFVPTNVVPNISVMQAIYTRIGMDPFFAGAVYTNDGV